MGLNQERPSRAAPAPAPSRLQERSPTSAAPGQPSGRAASVSGAQPARRAPCCSPHGRAAIGRAQLAIARQHRRRPAPGHCSRRGEPASPRHQLLTPQRGKRAGHCPQAAPSQTRDAASPVPVQLFQVWFSPRGGQRPRKRVPSPRGQLALRPPCPSWLGPLLWSGESTSEGPNSAQPPSPEPERGEGIAAPAALLICNGFKSPLRQEPIPAGNINDIVPECTFTQLMPLSSRR